MAEVKGKPELVEAHNLHISLFTNGQIGVSYPQDLVLALRLLGEATKVLANQVGMKILGLTQPAEQPLIQVPSVIMPKDFKGRG